MENNKYNAHLFYVLSIILLVFSSGCSLKNVATIKLNDDGYYYFKSNPISVWAPVYFMSDMYVYDTVDTVTLVTGSGYWQSGGMYKLEVVDKEVFFKNDSNFVNLSKEHFSKMAENAPYDLKFELVSSKEITINNKNAYQSGYIEKNKAVLMINTIMHENFVTIASLIYPASKSDDIQAQFPWVFFDEFTNSISDTRLPGHGVKFDYNKWVEETKELRDR